MEPLVKEYLRSHTFQELEDEFGICARPNSGFDKFSLNYDQIKSKPGVQISDECRGLIVRPIIDHIMGESWKDIVVGDVEVVAWPMTRFFNYGMVQADDVDWNDVNLRVYEKVDGTCMIVYWDAVQEKWHAATRSVPEADLPINSSDLEIGDMTFSQLFLKALIETREERDVPLPWAKCALCDVQRDEAAHPDLLCPVNDTTPHAWTVDGFDKVIDLNKELTYVFELVSRHNQIVVDYPDPRVYLLAARHTATGKEIAIETLRLDHVRRPKTWLIKDPVSLGAFINAFSPSELEGAVVCDSAFRRLKIKSMAYVLAHKSKDSVTASPRNALEAIICEKIDDIVPLVPKPVGEKMLKMQEAYAQYCKKVDDNFTQFKAASASRKHFAEQVMLSNDWMTPYFNLWEGKASSAHGWIKDTCEKGKLSTSSLDVILSKLSL